MLVTRHMTVLLREPALAFSGGSCCGQGPEGRPGCNSGASVKEVDQGAEDDDLPPPQDAQACTQACLPAQVYAQGQQAGPIPDHQVRALACTSSLSILRASVDHCRRVKGMGNVWCEMQRKRDAVEACGGCCCLQMQQQPTQASMLGLAESKIYLEENCQHGTHNLVCVYQVHSDGVTGGGVGCHGVEFLD